MDTPYMAKLFIGKVKQLGDPKAKNPMDRLWETGMLKESVDTKVWLTETGFVGDEVADKKNHGGKEKAVFAYPVAHYEKWQNEFHHPDLKVGGMGENLAIVGLDEHSVCIGDTYQLGEAIVQVSQPRQPCWRPARRFRKLDFALQIQKTGRTGWYFRVIKEGFVQANSPLRLLERPYPKWTIHQCNIVMHEKKDDLQLARELAQCLLLAESWKKTLQKRLEGEVSTIENRVYGPNKE